MYPVLLEELRKAERYIFMEYFIVEKGEMWDSILEILKEKAAAGVEVRFMYDGMCCLTLMPYGYPKQLEKYGIHCKCFLRCVRSFLPIRITVTTVRSQSLMATLPLPAE